MDALSGWTPVIAVLAASAAHADPVDRWRAYITEASARFGVPAPWIERVIRAESGGRTMLAGRPITSPAGAMGPMQLMPATWSRMRARLSLGHDPYDPRDNILAGTFYLRMMRDRFGYPGLFAAYNAGPARYTRYLAGGAPLPAETRLYLAKVGGAAIAGGPTASPARAGSLFFALQAQRRPGPGTLFIDLSRR